MPTFLDHHRGPYIFCVIRPGVVTRSGRAKPSTSEWLRGSEVDRDDVESEARALLADPRDTISSVWVWSVREDAFVGGYR